MNLFKKDGKLCCHFQKYSVNDLSVSLEYRGQHYNMLEVKSGEWEIIGNGSTAQSFVDGVGVFELNAQKADGGLILSASLKTDKSFEKRRCYRFHINGFLSMHANTLLFNDAVLGRTRDLEMGSRPRALKLVPNQKEEGVH